MQAGTAPYLGSAPSVASGNGSLVLSGNKTTTLAATGNSTLTLPSGNGTVLTSNAAGTLDQTLTAGNTSSQVPTLSGGAIIAGSTLSTSGFSGGLLFSNSIVVSNGNSIGGGGLGFTGVNYPTFVGDGSGNWDVFGNLQMQSSSGISMGGNALHPSSTTSIASSGSDVTITDANGYQYHFLNGLTLQGGGVVLNMGGGTLIGGNLVTTSAATSGTVTSGTTGAEETTYLSSGSTITSLTFSLNTGTGNSVAGQIKRLISKSAITTLTVSGTVSAGASLTSMTAGQCAAWQAIDANGTYIRIQ